MAKNPNPFWNDEYAAMFTNFDPNSMVEQFSKMLNDAAIPGVDVDAVLESQRKNVEALTKANQVALEGAQTLAQRQAQIVQQTMDEIAAAAEEMGKSDTPQGIAARQTELTKKAFETAIAHMRDLAEVMSKSNTVAAETINARITEVLDEMKDVVLKQK